MTGKRKQTRRGAGVGRQPQRVVAAETFCPTHEDVAELAAWYATIAPQYAGVARRDWRTVPETEPGYEYVGPGSGIEEDDSERVDLTGSPEVATKPQQPRRKKETARLKNGRAVKTVKARARR